MNDRELNRLLRKAPVPPRPSGGNTEFADTILTKLPRVRFVIPGSLPSRRILVVAGFLGLTTAAAISLYRHPRPAVDLPPPPPMTLFQAVEPGPVAPSP